VGARIRTYLLERSRLVFQPVSERNYHIFYQLCAGAPIKERRDLGLDTDINKFEYLKGGGPTSTPIPGVDDAAEFQATQQALSVVGIGIEKQWAVFKLLAALLHLGNVKITGVRNDSSIDDTDPALQLATRFLGVNLADFKKWTIKKQITTRSEKITTSLNSAQAMVVRDSVSKFLYACLFEWLVNIVNESLAGEGGDAAANAETFIGVLDIYGFEHFKKVGWFSVRFAFYSYFRSRTPSSSSASTTPMRSCNKRYPSPSHSLVKILMCHSSSTLMSSSSSRTSMFARKSTGRSSTSRTTSRASASSSRSSVYSRSLTKSLVYHPAAISRSCRSSTTSS
jgi:hypothetical protein